MGSSRLNNQNVRLQLVCTVSTDTQVQLVRRIVGLERLAHPQNRVRRGHGYSSQLGRLGDDCTPACRQRLPNLRKVVLLECENFSAIHLNVVKMKKIESQQAYNILWAVQGIHEVLP